MIPKYRAWIKAEKRMVEVAQINFRDKTIAYVTTVETDDFIDTKFHYAFFEDIVLMQSTGLKDKNGVEIFEGDICNECGYDDDTRNVLIERDEDHGGWCWSYMMDEYMYKTHEQYEVLGNKFTHPHLLEA